MYIYTHREREKEGERERASMSEVSSRACRTRGASLPRSTCAREREFFIDNLLVRSHCIVEMIWWTGLKP